MFYLNVLFILSHIFPWDKDIFYFVCLLWIFISMKPMMKHKLFIESSKSDIIDIMSNSKHQVG